ncbi:MAG: hypothetical protein ACYTG7_21555, partial [Planctomycetota bacterium]
TKVDVYISVSIMGGMNLYWPTFSLTPVRMPANLKAGFNVEDYVLAQYQLPTVPGNVDITWEMLIYQTGFTDDDHLLSCSMDMVYVDP